MKFTAINNTLLPTSNEAEQFIKDNQGRDCYLTIEEQTRTLRQNKYLWVMFQIIADWYNEGNDNESGEHYSKDSAKGRILYEVGHADFYIATENGTKYGVIKPTHNLSKKDFSLLTETIIKVMATKGLSIFTPEEFFNN